MATYLELKQKAEKMLAEAEQMRQKETDDVIASIKEQMKAYGLTPQDLGFGSASRKKAAGKPTRAPAKYRGPDGQTWSGGRGRKPLWVVEALKAGKKIEDFAI